MARIIGRDKEIDEIKRLYFSDKPQLLAVYGRRRIGKTFLVDEALKGLITFRHAGLSPIDEKGNTKNIYLKEEIGGFAIHIMKKSEYSGLYGDYSSFSNELDELSDAESESVEHED